MTDTAPCQHGLDKTAYRGMRAVETTDDTVTFECPTCGARQVALRCAGIARSGDRCRRSTINGEATCFLHRRRVAVAEVAR